MGWEDGRKAGHTWVWHMSFLHPPSRVWCPLLLCLSELEEYQERLVSAHRGFSQSGSVKVVYLSQCFPVFFSPVTHFDGIKSLDLFKLLSVKTAGSQLANFNTRQNPLVKNDCFELFSR